MPKKSKRRGRFVPKQNVGNDGANTSSAISNDAVEIIGSPVQSLVDNNSYRVIKLANGITATLVSVPVHTFPTDSYSSQPHVKKAITTNTDRSSKIDEQNPGWCERMKEKKRVITREAFFELCVNVGSYSDPRQVPGASRLLSRMLLQQSKKYCGDDDSFSDWMWKKDGYHHVKDDGEKTVYTINTELDHLPEALDRFSQGLIHPLLSPVTMSRLRTKLVSEYEKYICNRSKMDKRAKQHLFKNLASAKHSTRVYGKHYLKALSLPSDEKVYKEIIKFRERHYSAHRMTIVIKAELPLETLQQLIVDFFSKVPNNGLPLGEFDQYHFMNAFNKSQFERLYKLNNYPRSGCDPTTINLKKSPNRLEVTWSMPPSQWLYRTKPDRYWAWLLTHEGNGSLLNYLKNEHLCTNIVSGIGEKEFADNSIYTLFSITMALTEEGRKDYKRVLDILFSYLNFLREVGLQPKLYEQLRQIEEARFRYYQHLDLDHDVKKLSVYMHLYPPVDYLTAKKLYFDYDPISISTYLDLMSPERANLILYEGTSKEPQCEFPSAAIPEEWVRSWEHAKPMSVFEISLRNIYRADDFTIITVNENTPQKPVNIYSDDSCEIWWGIGTNFRTPMCFINFIFVNPLPLMSAEFGSMTDMLAEVLQRIINTELYPARAAGATFKISREREEGISLEISCFSQKVTVILEAIATLIRNCLVYISNEFFETTKKDMLTAYEDQILAKYIGDNSLTEDLRLAVLKVVHWTKMDRYDALSTIDINQFRLFVSVFMDHVYVKCLAQGNVYGDFVIPNILHFLRVCTFGLLLKNERPQLRVNELPKGTTFFKATSFIKNTRSVTVKNYYQCAGYSMRAVVMVDLLTSIIEDEVFEELRECGSIDSVEYSTSFMLHDQGAVGYSIEMSEENDSNSPKSTHNLDMKIEKLRRSFRSLFEEMTDEEWCSVLDVFMDQKKLPTGAHKLGYELRRNWGEIIAGTNVFNRQEEELNLIKNMTVEEIRKWMAYFTTSGINLRKLSIQIDERTLGSLEPVNLQRKYDLRYSDVLVPVAMKKKLHRNIINVAHFKSLLNPLPIPEKR